MEGWSARVLALHEASQSSLTEYFLRSIPCMLMAAAAFHHLHPCMLMAAAAASSSSSDSLWKYDVFLNFRGLEAAASSSAISTKLWIRKQSTPSLTPKSFKRQRPFGAPGSY